MDENDDASDRDEQDDGELDDRDDGRLRHIEPEPVTMGRSRWEVLAVDGVADLANELGLAPTSLAWFADVRSYERRVDAEQLRHYRYRWLPKRSGGARLIEAPKGTLKLVQRRVLHEILDLVPPHDAAHAFRRHRSAHTYVAPHVGQHVVIRFDLEAFFASVPAARVFRIFRAIGYAPPVAHALTGLTTNAVPHDVRKGCPPSPSGREHERRRMLHRLAHPHLPQGAPTSPALANLAALRLDRRLEGLARSFGLTYTRYADDLAFSGNHRHLRVLDRLVELVDTIVVGEGFHLNVAKTTVATAAHRQRLAGLVINERRNIARRDYDRLRAVLHDAIVNGPQAANRERHDDLRSHLLGQIAWIEAGNPARAAKLRAMFERIAW